MRTVKAIINEYGKVELLEPVSLGDKRQALATILEKNYVETEPSLLTFLNHLASIPASSRNPEAIEVSIEAERNAWDE